MHTKYRKISITDETASAFEYEDGVTHFALPTFRLNDVCFGPRQDRELVLYLVFEHLEQDLASYMQRMPARSYVSPHMIQVIN